SMLARSTRALPFFALAAAAVGCASVRHPLLETSPYHYVSEAATLELHSHLFMNEGVPIFHGDFFANDLEVEDWKSEFRSQANVETLERSGIGLLVATMYAHPLMPGGRKAAILKQLGSARRFVAEHPDWVIATEPENARSALALGKRVLVLAL